MTEEAPAGKPPETTPPSKGRKKFVFLGIGTAGVIIGILAFYLYFQPNIHVIESLIYNPVKKPEFITVLNYGRVSTSGDIDYTFDKAGLHELTFDNSFSFISEKQVVFSYSTTAVPTNFDKFDTINCNIAAGSRCVLEVNAQMGDYITGQLSIRGGSGNDVNFYINYPVCSQMVSFTFGLANTGPVDGFAKVELLADGKSVWWNEFFVKSGEQTSKIGTANLDDCSDHEYSIVLSDQRK